MTVPSDLETASLEIEASQAESSQAESPAESIEAPNSDLVSDLADDLAEAQDGQTLTADHLPAAVDADPAEAELGEALADPVKLEAEADLDSDNSISDANGAGEPPNNGSDYFSDDDDPDEPKDFMDEVPDDLEMSLFDHLEELRLRIFYALIAVVLGIIVCFIFVNPIVKILEVPAHGIKFLQLAPGEYFFVSLKVAGYSGLVISSPFILYQIVQFVLPGLTRRERRLLAPVVLGSTVLFAAGIIFAYFALIPAALNFFVTYGEGVVEQMWSIERYFEFVLLLLFSTGLAFQIPIIQLLLGALGLVNSKQMLSGWRFVVVGGAVLGAVLTPSTDPVTQSLLAGAVLALYFGGIGLVKLIGR
jgi:sec-independent protein translocase protein TatC